MKYRYDGRDYLAYGYTDIFARAKQHTIEEDHKKKIEIVQECVRKANATAIA